MSPSRHGQPRPEVPWCPPCQESAPLALWQLGNTLQVHPDTDPKRFLDFLVGCAIDGNVEIGADPVPTTATSVCITPKRRHGPGIDDGNEPTRSTTIYHFPILRRRQVLDLVNGFDGVMGKPPVTLRVRSSTVGLPFGNNVSRENALISARLETPNTRQGSRRHSSRRPPCSSATGEAGQRCGRTRHRLTVIHRDPATPS